MGGFSLGPPLVCLWLLIACVVSDLTAFYFASCTSLSTTESSKLSPTHKLHSIQDCKMDEETLLQQATLCLIREIACCDQQVFLSFPYPGEHMPPLVVDPLSFVLHVLPTSTDSSPIYSICIYYICIKLIIYAFKITACNRIFIDIPAGKT